VRKTGYTFQEYADMRLVLNEARDDGAAAVMLYVEGSSRHRLLK
jgi:hypothetical protein